MTKATRKYFHENIDDAETANILTQLIFPRLRYILEKMKRALYEVPFLKNILAFRVCCFLLGRNKRGLGPLHC